MGPRWNIDKSSSYIYLFIVAKPYRIVIIIIIVSIPILLSFYIPSICLSVSQPAASCTVFFFFFRAGVR